MVARMTIESGEGQPLSFELTPFERVFLGRRSKENHIILRDFNASRNHAQVFYQDDQWFIEDRDTKNGTWVNGQKIQGTILPLNDGCEIKIGDVLLRFSCSLTSEKNNQNYAPIKQPAGPNPIPDEDPTNSISSHLEPDELKALVWYHHSTQFDQSADQIILKALQVAQEQTLATICSFSGSDSENQMPRLSFPEKKELDIELSRRICNQTNQSSTPVWLSRHIKPEDCDGSLAGFTDAICIPIRNSADFSKRQPLLGQLHVYRQNGVFSNRQYYFCEALGSYLSSGLSVLRNRRVLEADNPPPSVISSHTTGSLLGNSKVMQRLRSEISRLAKGPCSVLILGESGSGKELVAQELHRQSARCDAPFVPVNCGSITGTLAESELFGHLVGSFTGAIKNRLGYFVNADQGTLFLDEIGELTPGIQAMLLRVLENRRVKSVGSDQETTVDIRLISATNRDLLKDSPNGQRFREDLFYRLGSIIRVPPLRDRLEDIPQLAGHFMAGFRQQYKRDTTLTAEAMESLKNYHWPGNVRQLRTVLETAVAMASGDTISSDDLPLSSSHAPLHGTLPTLNLKELKKLAIQQALQKTQRNISQAARILGIHRDTLTTLLNEE